MNTLAIKNQQDVIVSLDGKIADIGDSESI